MLVDRRRARPRCRRVHPETRRKTIAARRVLGPQHRSDRCTGVLQRAQRLRARQRRNRGTYTLVQRFDARQTIDTWLDNDMLESPQSVRSHARVARLLARALDSGTVYRLDAPDDEEHRSNWVGVGTTGFHEFVAIDRQQEAMHLVVASDD